MATAATASTAMTAVRAASRFMFVSFRSGFLRFADPRVPAKLRPIVIPAELTSGEGWP